MPKLKNKIIEKKKQVNSINRLLSTLTYGLIIIIGLRYIARDLISPLLLAIFLTVLLFPLFRWFRKRGFSSSFSIILMILTFFIITGLIVVFLTWSFTLLAGSLTQYTEGFKESFIKLTSTVNISEQTTTQITQNITPQNIEAIVRLISDSLGNIVFYFIIIPILSILMILEIDSISTGMLEIIGISKINVDKFKKFGESIMIYISSRLKVNILTGVLFSIVLIVLGVPFPFVWGFLTIVTSFIPYIGIVIASTPPILLAFSNGGIVPVILIIVAISLINLFAENVLSPIILGKEAKISTVVVFIALIFWVWLLGPIGAILSVPLTVILKIILEEYPETRPIAILMEGNSGIERKNNRNYQIIINKIIQIVKIKFR
jgi:predicted PurR-regulated permease PerM